MDKKQVVNILNNHSGVFIKHYKVNSIKQLHRIHEDFNFAYKVIDRQFFEDLEGYKGMVTYKILEKIVLKGDNNEISKIN